MNHLVFKMTEAAWYVRLPLEAMASSLLWMALGLFLTRLLSKQPAGLRALIWVICFAGIAVWIPMRLSGVSVEVPVLPAPTAVIGDQEHAVSVQPKPDVENSKLPRVATTEMSSAALPDVPDRATPHGNAPLHIDFTSALAIVWWVGFVFLGTRLMGALFSLAKLRRAARPVAEMSPVRSVLCAMESASNGLNGCEVLIHPTIVSPMLFGVWRRVILLPECAESWSESRIRLVLLHEWAHVRRHDFAATILAEIVACFCWGNPLVWLGLGRFRAIVEIAADDLAVEGESEPTQYASELLGIIREMRALTVRHGMALGMADRSVIERRIKSLLDPLTKHRLGRRRVAWAVAIGAILIAGISTMEVVRATGDRNVKSSHVDEKQSIHIVCVDMDGKTVPHAQVIGEQFDVPKAGRLQPIYFGPVFADEKGNATLTTPIKQREAKHRYRHFYARVNGKLVGAASFWDEMPKDGVVKIIMVPSFTAAGKVTVPKGFDPRKVGVEVLDISVEPTGDRALGNFGYDRIEGPDVVPPWLDWFHATPDKEGRFEIPNLPVWGNSHLSATGTGLGETQHTFFKAQNDPTAPRRSFSLSMEREAIVSGRVIGPKDAAMPGVIVYCQAAGAAIHPGVIHPYWTRTDNAGNYAIHGLPAEQSFTVWTAQRNGLVAPAASTKEIGPGESARVDFSLKSGCLVNGTVRNGKTGAPLAGAEIRAASSAPNEREEPIGNAVAASDGTYQVRVPQGNVTIYASGFDQGMTNRPPSLSEHSFVIGTNDHEKTSVDFTLMPQMPEEKALASKPKPIVTLKVVDENGKPLEGVPVTFSEGADRDVNSFSFSGTLGLTRADGSLKAEVDPAKKIQVMVGGGRFSSAKSSEFDAKTKPEYDLGTFTVRPANATIRGTIVDEKGDPIKGAWIDCYSQHKRNYGTTAMIPTDANGRFEIPHVLADEPANISARMPGYQNAWRKDIAPGTTDLKIVLRSQLQPQLLGTWKLKANFPGEEGRTRNAPEEITFTKDPHGKIYYGAAVTFAPDPKHWSGAWEYQLHDEDLIDLLSQIESGADRPPFYRAGYSLKGDELKLIWLTVGYTGAKTIYERVPSSVEAVLKNSPKVDDGIKR
jgi:beta-lactamase regulating signal transducer with metallopeptidase domain